jgi:hypothetical protein
MKTKTTKAAGKASLDPLVRRSFDTFQWLDGYRESQMRQDEPYVWNGMVGVRKFRITVEPVDEPVDVLRQRVQDLWDKCDNHHNWQPLQAVATSLGMGRLEKTPNAGREGTGNP